MSKTVEIEGAGPSWLEPQRNSASNPTSDVQNGGMATHLVKMLCGLGSLVVREPACTPLGSEDAQRLQVLVKLAEFWDAPCTHAKGKRLLRR